MLVVLYSFCSWSSQGEAGAREQRAMKHLQCVGTRCGGQLRGSKPGVCACLKMKNKKSGIPGLYIRQRRAGPATPVVLGHETHQTVRDLGLAVAPSRAKLKAEFEPQSTHSGSPKIHFSWGFIGVPVPTSGK